MILTMSSKLYPGFEPHSLGHVFEDAGVTAFFGHRGADSEALALAFPDYTLSILKQTHSDRVVSAATVIRSGDPIDADAQFTDEKRIALCIRTADCVPVLIHDRDSGLIAAIHAGWRGIANSIVVKTGQTLKSKGASLDRARAWIGPHIGVESFEVGNDVAAHLESAFDAVRGFSGEQTSIVRREGAEKPHVDLLRIVRAQLVSIGIGRERTLELALDTVTSERHESFRRDREKGGRQFSSITLK